MTDNRKLRIAVGVSGGGRSLGNLLDHQASNPYEIGLVFSSSQTAGANEIAKKAKVPLLVLDFAPIHWEITKEKLYQSLEYYGIDLVVLAGFLKLLPIDSHWENKIINIHPALLPKYGGKGMHGHYVHEAVIKSGDIQSGATVHFVNECYDEGSIIARATVEIESLETPESLAQKVFKAECMLLPAVISALSSGQLPRNTLAQLDQTGRIT